MKAEISFLVTSSRRALVVILLSTAVLTVVGVRGAQSPPMPPPWRALNIWTFNDTNLLSSAGFPPRNTFGLYSVGSFSGNAVLVVGNSALLTYNEMETNGVTNITCNAGSLEFWFRPEWASANTGGFGPGVFGRLLELGVYTTNASYGRWSVYFDAGGTNIYFSAQTNGAGTTFLSAPIQWPPTGGT